jgi:glycosyltransferase involved in cell wall biosynthesis
MSAGELRFAVFIVAYNAVTTLRKVLDRIPVEAWNNVEEVYVFDDASQDDTELLGLGYKSTRGIDKLKIYRNEYNLGYGGNQKKGYAYAIEKGFDYVILLHGDGQYAPEVIPEFIAMAKAHRPAAVFGSRMLIPGDARKGGMPFYKFIGNRILTVAENFMLGSRLSEFHSGYRMYSVEALRKLHFQAYTDDFHFDTQIIVELIHHGFDIREIPIPTYYGKEICYVNGMKYAKDVALSVLQYKLYSAGLLSCDWIGGEPGAQRRYRPKRGPFSSHMRITRLVPANSRVLDVGAEGNYVSALLEKGCRVYGINDRHPGGEIARLYEEYLVRDLDIDGLPSASDVGHFDCVILADVLEHLRTAPAALSAAKSLLTAHGIVVASTGNVANWWIRLNLLFGRFNYGKRGILDESHVRLYTRKTFRRLLEEQGFVIVTSKVTPIPFELLAGPGRFSRRFWPALEYIYYGFARVWPALFAYQFVLVGRPARPVMGGSDGA